MKLCELCKQHPSTGPKTIEIIELRGIVKYEDKELCDECFATYNQTNE